MKKLISIVTGIVFSMALYGQQPGDALFNAPYVHQIHIDFPQQNWWDSLQYYKSFSDTSGNDLYMSARVVINADTVNTVGVRLKGNSSYGHPGYKKPLKLQFNEFVQGQTYNGLKSFHLNNSAYDPTQIREKLMLDVFRRHGLPAPRCTFAAVYFNGNYVGLYKIVESVDKTFLENRFGDDRGNLFKGDPAGTLQWYGNNPTPYYGNYELTTNETENDWSGLIDLIDRINNSGNQFPQRIREKFDVDAYLWALAINNIFVNPDSYLFNPHNYYLYEDSVSLKFEWISWDVGLGFGIFPFWSQNRSQDLDIFFLPNNPDRVPLNVQLYKYDEFRKIYLDAYCTIYNEDFNPEKLFPRIDSLAAVVRPWVYLEDPANRMYTPEQFEGNLGFTTYSAWIASDIPGLKKFANVRRGQIAVRLCREGWSCALGNTAQPVSEENIHVFPNPSNGKVSVMFEAPDPKTAVLYTITDMSGRVIFSENKILDDGFYYRELDFSCYASGVYVLRVIGTCDEIRKKIVITE